MPGTRSSSTASTSNPNATTCSPGSPTFFDTSPAKGDRIHCPFREFDECGDGINGRGYARTSFQKHLTDRHCSSEAAKERCRERLCKNREVYTAWEKILQQMHCWLCTHCMALRAWKKSCKHNNVNIPSPSNGTYVNFLISDIAKPPSAASNKLATVVDTMASISVELLNEVFKRRFTTIKSIPQPCRLNFSRTLKSCLDAIILSPREISTWIKLLLLPISTLNLYIPKSSSEERAGNRRKLQIASINKALNEWREPSGCITLIQRLLQQPKRCRVSKPKKKKSQESANLEACRKKMSNGHYTAAIRVLYSDGIAPCDENTITELMLKHPTAAPPAIPNEAINCDALSVDSAAVLKAIKSFPKGTSCGRDGLRAQHLLDSMSGAAAAVAEELLSSITKVVNLWLAGRCPTPLGEYIASAPLTPLQKPGGGIRPIAVGTIWRRLVSKLAATSVGKDMASYLGDFQFGVGVPCGGEGILHSVNRLVELKGHQNDTSMLLVDFSNAFNLVDRTSLIQEVRAQCPAISYWVEFCYANPARLYYNDNILSSAQGVQQGDPLGPLLFALTLHPVVKKIAAHCRLDLQAWYLDDGTLIGDTLEVSKALSIVQSEGVSRGLHLNVHKTELFWPTIDPRSLQEGVFPHNISRPSSGVKLLGGPVSPNLQFCKDMVLQRVHKTIHLMDAVKKLRDPQCELLLLRNCTGVSKLYFTMRTTSPLALEPATSIFDDHLYKYLRLLVTADGAGFGPLQFRLATLPIRDGGLGIYTMGDTSKYCYLASYFQTQPVQRTILGSLPAAGLSPICNQAIDAYNQVCDSNSTSLSFDTAAPTPMHFMHSLAVKYFDYVKKHLPDNHNLTTRDSVLWQSNKLKHAQDYLLAIPISGLQQTISPRQFRCILCYRLGIPLFPEGGRCSICNRDMDIYGDHALHCASEVGIKFRHDHARDVFIDICVRARVAVTKEAQLGLTSEGNRTLLPADLLVHNWENGRDTCMDVTVVSPFTSDIRSFVPGQAIAKAVLRKRNKYLTTCEAHGYGLGVLAFTTLGELGEDTVVFLKRLKNCLANNDADCNSSRFLFHRIGVAIQRGVGAQLVARMPSNPV